MSIKEAIKMQEDKHEQFIVERRKYFKRLADGVSADEAHRILIYIEDTQRQMSKVEYAIDVLYEILID